MFKTVYFRFNKKKIIRKIRITLSYYYYNTRYYNYFLPFHLTLKYSVKYYLPICFNVENINRKCTYLYKLKPFQWYNIIILWQSEYIYKVCCI